MNRAIKELYNNMNERELYKQQEYLFSYYFDRHNELNIKECNAILSQSNYCLALINSLKLVKQK